MNTVVIDNLYFLLVADLFHESSTLPDISDYLTALPLKSGDQQSIV